MKETEMVMDWSR